MRSARPNPSPGLVLAVVSFGVFVAADDLTVVTTMLRQMIGDFEITLPDGVDQAAWIVDVYLIGYVAVMPFMGRVSDLFGRRRIYLVAFGLFFVGSVVIPFAGGYGTLLFGRVLTAVGGGALVPVGMAIVGDVYRPQRRATALGVLGAVDTIGWVWGPLFGALLVRYLSWRWQFYLNLPLAVAGMAMAWVVLRNLDTPTAKGRVDWAGAGALTAALIALCVALLEGSEIQSVTGLEELTGERDINTTPLFLLAAGALAVFIWLEKRAEHPIVDLGLFRLPNFTPAVIVNFLVGGALIIAMVDVPLFINVVERALAESAVASGRVLSALTVSMALFAYVGGRLTPRFGYRPVTVAGLGLALGAYLAMGTMWAVDTSQAAMAWQLAALGTGFGLVTAPTNAAVVNAAPAQRRGTAAGLVLVFRLMGLAVGLSALTGWGLYRFNSLRDRLELPPVDDPTYQDALSAAQGDLTSQAIAETFLAAAVVVAIAMLVALALHREQQPVQAQF